MSKAVPKEWTPDQLATAIEVLIKDLPAGGRVPSEKELSDRFGVSRALVRSALVRLENRHLLRRVRGSGTFVNRRIDYPISARRAPSFHDTVAAAGGDSRTMMIGTSNEAFPAAAMSLISLWLGEPPDLGAHQHVRRLSHINDLPASFLEEWFFDDVVDEAAVAVDLYGSVNAVMVGRGYRPRRAGCRATVEVPPPLVRDRLDLAEHEMTWVVQSLVRNADDERPLFYSRAWTRQDAVRMVFELDG